MRDLYEAVWQHIVARGLVGRTPVESRYDVADVAGSVERRGALAPVG